MRKLLLAATLLAPLGAHAQTTVIDPLHGFCITVTCADHSLPGGVTVTTANNPPGFNGNGFGFTISPGPQTGPFFLLVAEPNNVSDTTPSVSGTINGVAATPLSITGEGAWTTGDLDQQANVKVLAPSAKPTNPLANFLPFTDSVDAGDTGYNLTALIFGSEQIQDNKNAGPAAMDFTDTNLPVGSMIFGFFDSPKSGWVATASSGVLFVNTASTTSIPEPAGIALFGAGLCAITMARIGFRRRRGL